VNDSRPQPIWAALLTKESLTAVVILFMLVSRDLGFAIPQDTQLQIILVVTLVGAAAAGKWAKDRSTPTAAPQLQSGTTVAVTDDQGNVKQKTV
jgi:hypothetical protein